MSRGCPQYVVTKETELRSQTSRRIYDRSDVRSTPQLQRQRLGDASEQSSCLLGSTNSEPMMRQSCMFEGVRVVGIAQLDELGPRVCCSIRIHEVQQRGTSTKRVQPHHLVTRPLCSHSHLVKALKCELDGAGCDVVALFQRRYDSTTDSRDDEGVGRCEKFDDVVRQRLTEDRCRDRKRRLEPRLSKARRSSNNLGRLAKIASRQVRLSHELRGVRQRLQYP